MKLGPRTLYARETFSSSVLPLKQECVERMIYFLVPRPKGSGFQVSTEWAAKQVADELIDQWIWCNIYPGDRAWIITKLVRLYTEFKALQATPTLRRTEKWVTEKVDPFLHSLGGAFDIRTTNLKFRKTQEIQFGVKETEEEEKFYLDQVKGEHVAYFDGFVDRKWKVMDVRRKREQESFEKRKADAKEDESRNKVVAVPEEFGGDSEEDQVDDDYSSKDEEDEQSSKRRRTEVNESNPDNDNDLPEHWRHVRKTIRNVRHEWKRSVDRMIS